MRNSWIRAALLAAPPLLLASTFLVFQAGVAAFGSVGGYLARFVFYWLFWCLLFGGAAVGTDLARLFRPVSRPLGDWPWIAAVALVAPLALGFGYAFPRAIGSASLTVVLLSLALAVVNATLEELLWRGAYLKAFPDSVVWGWLYPTVGFAVWHLAPQSIFPNPAPGGAWALVVVAGLAGLGWAWVARATGTILYVSLAHILFDFSGLGGRLYLG